MVSAPLVVVLDANVLFPFTLRDTLLRAAAAGLYQVRWTAVTGYEPLIATMKNDEKDRHVVAAAVESGAQVVTTANLKDFTPLPEGVEAQSPDEFLCNLFDADPDIFVDMLREQAGDLVKPPMSFEELLERLARVVPDLVVLVREHVAICSP